MPSIVYVLSNVIVLFTNAVLSLPKIGESFGGRDHTTVLHACEKIKKEIKIDPSLSEDIRNLKEEIQ